VVQLLAARRRGDLPGVAELAQRLQAVAGAPERAQPGLGEELRGLALINLGSAEGWAARPEEARRHLEQGIAVARRIGRPYLEFTGLAYQAPVEFYRSFRRAAERSRQAIDLAERQGWTDDPPAGFAYMALGSVLAWWGRLDEAEAWVQRAERTVRAEADPAAALRVLYFRGQFELADRSARWPRSAPPSASPDRIRSPGRSGHGSCTPWCASATPSAPSRPWPASANPTATAGRCAAPPRCCGSPSTIRTRRPPRSRRSWTALPP
jgi:tetratricopeptide (TPR) repeat protein